MADDANKMINPPSSDTATPQEPGNASNEQVVPKPNTQSTDNALKSDQPAQQQARAPSPGVQQAESTLIEAFPGIEPKVIKAVLVASGGRLEQAFNALLGMSDPDFNAAASPQPAPTTETTAAQRQMEQDEMYARQLAQHYQSSAQRSQRPPQDPRLPPRQRSEQDELYRDDDRERNFFDDDLPEIKEGVRKTFLETQTKFSSWVSKIQKKLEGDDQDPYNGPPVLDKPSSSTYGPRTSSRNHRSRDQSRDRMHSDGFDADPHEITGDIDSLALNDDNGPRTTSRPLANPNLFKATPPTPPNSGPVDEVEAADRKGQSSVKSAKWQPLTSLEPRAEADDDPFSVGDEGDDEVSDSVKDTAKPNVKDDAKDDAKDTETGDKSTDVRAADTARLKDAAATKGDVDDTKKGLEEHEKGSLDNKDKTAEALLAGESVK